MNESKTMCADIDIEPSRDYLYEYMSEKIRQRHWHVSTSIRVILLRTRLIKVLLIIERITLMNITLVNKDRNTK